ncbi:MAG: sigma-70 family RNA polymerase sigma factor, partial [Bryobacterales bacterium]|nr:sigma-70 family RNA polymerase sigma factor [Bryobacterales bacterium]
MGTSVSGNEAGSTARPAREASWGELIARCAKGDSDGLAALYDESSSLVYRVALRFVANPADAEEVTMDVYQQVWRTAERYAGERGTVSAWLVTLARSRALDKVRARASRARAEEPLPEFRELHFAGAGPEDATLATQEQRRIRAALSTFPHEQREAVELAFYSGLTHAELADRLRQPLGTVKTRIRSAMMKLREQLGD